MQYVSNHIIYHTAQADWPLFILQPIRVFAQHLNVQCSVYTASAIRVCLKPITSTSSTCLHLLGYLCMPIYAAATSYLTRSQQRVCVSVGSSKSYLLCSIIGSRSTLLRWNTLKLSYSITRKNHRWNYISEKLWINRTVQLSEVVFSKTILFYNHSILDTLFC